MTRRNPPGFLILCVLLLSCYTPASVSPTVAVPGSPHGLANASILVYPDDGVETLLTRIASARQRVLVTIYLLTYQRFFDAFKLARQNGATVRVMIEQQPVGDTTSAQAAFDKLKNSGIDTRYTNPYFRLTHQKSLIVDNTAIILTANLSSSGFLYNREFGITTDDPAVVSEMVSVFNADWSRTPISPDTPNLVWSPINSRARIDSLIASTKKALSVYAEEVQDEEQAGALINAANAGVVVQLLISPPIDVTKQDANSIYLNKLQRGGVKVRYLAKPYIHAKAFLSDRKLGFIGSQNISAGSIEFNRELGVLVSDNTILQRLRNTFDKDWNAALER